MELHDNLACVRTKLKYMAMQKKKKMKKGYGKRSVNSMDDCFEFMSEPLYGFRTNVTFEQQCLNGECRVNLTNQAFDEVFGEVTTNDNNDTSLDNNDTSIDNNSISDDITFDAVTNDDITFEDIFDDRSQSRQTGIEFANDGPPDCITISILSLIHI